MTLSEAIRHAEEIAASKEQDIEALENIPGIYHDCEAIRNCRECATEHRQLAEWLRDYKRLLAIESGKDIRCGNCKHDGKGDGRCEKCYQYSGWEEVEE